MTTALLLATLLVTALLATAVLATAVPASALNGGGPSAVSGEMQIELVDLYNDVSYSHGDQRIEVTNGFGTFRFPWSDTDSTFSIQGHFYGDVTADGRNDAVVWASYTEENSAGVERTFDGVWVVHSDGGTIYVAGPTWVGSGAHGGLEYVEARDGYLAVSSFNGDHECCPTGVSRSRWVVRDDQLISAERLATVTYLDLTQHSSDHHATLTFLPGTASAIIESRPQAGSQAFVFDAKARQAVHLRNRWGTAKVRISRADTGAVVGTLAHNEDVNVPIDGRYLAEVHTSPVDRGQASFELTVSSRRSLYAPTWAPRARFDAETGSVSAHWPELISAHPGVDVAKVNRLVYATIENEIAEFAEIAASRPHADNDENALWIDYALTLSAYDLVSLDISVGRRTCCFDGEHRYTSDRHTMVIDLNRGQVLTLDDLVKPAHHDQLGSTWWQTIGATQPGLIEHGYVDEPTADQEWAGAVVRPHGIGLLKPDGVSSAVEALLTWERLAAMGEADTSSITKLAYRAGSNHNLPLATNQCGC